MNISFQEILKNINKTCEGTTLLRLKIEKDLYSITKSDILQIREVLATIANISLESLVILMIWQTQSWPDLILELPDDDAKKLLDVSNHKLDYLANKNIGNLFLTDPEEVLAHEAKRVEQFEAHLVRKRRCLLGKSNREYPSQSWPHEPKYLGLRNPD
jgi:hypothetical protein